MLVTFRLLLCHLGLFGQFGTVDKLGLVVVLLQPGDGLRRFPPPPSKDPIRFPRLAGSVVPPMPVTKHNIVKYVTKIGSERNLDCQFLKNKIKMFKSVM